VSYPPLRIQSGYSFRESLIRLPELLAQAQAFGLPALALTDRDNLFGAVPFTQLADAHGIHPILGAILSLADGTSLTLLIETPEGHANMSHLIAQRHRLGPPGWDEVAAHAGGLIALCGGEEGAVAMALEHNDFMGALAAARRLARIFGDRAYLEAHRPVPKLAALAASAGLPTVAAAPVRYMRPEDAELYLIAQRGYRRFIPDIPDHPLPTPEAWAARWRPWPEALETARAIAERCRYRLPLTRLHVPPFPDAADAQAVLHALCEPEATSVAWLATIHHLDATAALRLAGAGLGLAPELIAMTIAARGPEAADDAHRLVRQAIESTREPYATLMAAAHMLEGLPDHVAFRPGAAPDRGATERMRHPWW
jgi:DNA polymerase-3 subunit alpha